MKQITAIVIGAGLRGGNVYAAYALEHPNELKVVAVAEPNQERRLALAAKHHIPEELQFESYEELLEREKMADCAMVCTMDNMHYEPTKMALAKGYHVLCEKPMSSDAGEIIRMGMLAKEYDRILSICHVLRYSPFFMKIKSLLQEGRIGKLISIQHIEEVGYWHQAHSFVRGNWGNAKESSPMILQKCCHDMDILLWLIESPCTKVSSFGKLTYFKEECAPEGATERCLDGCPHREKCAFYAPKFYLEHPNGAGDGLVSAVTLSKERSDILEALRQGPYGRCVFHCDNTVVDHQVVSLEFENEVNVSFTMCAFTNQCARNIHLMGAGGEIYGNMETGVIEVHDFIDGSKDTICLHTTSGGHSGSDSSMMQDFVRVVSEERTDHLRTGADVSVDSHLMALAAEHSRVTGETIDFAAYKRSLACPE